MPVGYEGAPLTAVLIGELLAMGHNVIGITIDYRLPNDANPFVAAGPGFEYHILPGRRRAWRFNGLRPGRAIDLFRVERKMLSATIQAVHPDIVHAHWTYEFALGAIDSGVPHVVTAHDSPRAILFHSRSVYRALRWCMAREVFRRARCVTTVSPYMLAQLPSTVGHITTIVPNPVSRLAFSLGVPRCSGSTRRIAMICNGWGALKNPEAALRGFALWRSHEPTAELHLFGNGSGTGEAGHLWAASESLDKGVLFHGSLEHAALIRQLSQLDLLLHPALEESFGVVLAEAMALGIPVVAGSNSGAVPWVVGADSKPCPAVLADVSSPVAIATALADAFSSAYSDRSAACLLRARTLFSASAIGLAYERQYNAVLGRVAATAPVPQLKAIPVPK
jgi:L-malate glycosyltransferase